MEGKYLSGQGHLKMTPLMIRILFAPYTKAALLLSSLFPLYDRHSVPAISQLPRIQSSQSLPVPDDGRVGTSRYPTLGTALKSSS